VDTPLTSGRSIQRRLAAVAFADVTILKWKALRENLLEPKIAEHAAGVTVPRQEDHVNRRVLSLAA